MIKRIVLAAATVVVSCGVFAQENQPLEVIFDADGCPQEVNSLDESCGNGPDPKDGACRSSGAVVRWGPGASIGAIVPKSVSPPDSLHNCQHVSDFYQCVVKGNSGDEIYYNVVDVNNQCPLDPMIRIR
jgi:hypothetical protein